MELLIIGAASYIGNEVYKSAKQRNIKVIGTKNRMGGNDLLKYDITTDDITDIANKFSANDKYALICAAVPTIDTCFTNYEYSYNVNVTSTIRLLKKLNELDFKSVFLSTDSVFSGNEGYYSEYEKPMSINKYGSMKAEVENYIQEFQKNDCIMRISKIVGDMPHKRNVFTEWHELAIKDSPITCIKDNIFSPTDINDIVECFFVVVNNNLKGLYNICNAEHFERNELAYQFLRYMGLESKVYTKSLDEFNFKDARPLKTYMSNNKFVKETGYCFRNIKDIIEGYKDNIANEKKT